MGGMRKDREVGRKTGGTCDGIDNRKVLLSYIYTFIAVSVLS